MEVFLCVIYKFSFIHSFLQTDHVLILNDPFAEDPTEHDDVKDKYPDVLAKMKARLSELRQYMVPANNPPSDPASDPKNFGGVWSPGWC